MASVDGRPSVLLIDPHVDTAELYAWALKDAGFDVCCTTWGKRLPRSYAPDVVIAAMRTPDVAPVRRMVHARVPVILLVGWCEEGVTAARVGCEAIIQIPAAPSAIVSAVQALTAPPLSAPCPRPTSQRAAHHRHS